MNLFPNEIVREFVNPIRPIIAVDKKQFYDLIAGRSMVFYSAIEGDHDSVSDQIEYKLKPVAMEQQIDTVILQNIFRKAPTLQETSYIHEFYRRLFGEETNLIIGISEQEDLMHEIRLHILFG